MLALYKHQYVTFVHFIHIISTFLKWQFQHNEVQVTCICIWTELLIRRSRGWWIAWQIGEHLQTTVWEQLTSQVDILDNVSGHFHPCLLRHYQVFFNGMLGHFQPFMLWQNRVCLTTCWDISSPACCNKTRYFLMTRQDIFSCSCCKICIYINSWIRAGVKINYTWVGSGREQKYIISE